MTQKAPGFLRRSWPLARPAPVSGRLWLDLVWLAVIGALHGVVAPAIAGGLALVDLLTPWLVVVCVVAPLGRAGLLTVIGALIAETHSSVPAGMYVCTYWVMAVVIHVTRGTLSWRHGLPWVVAMALSSLWVAGFETLVLGVNAAGFRFTLGYGLTQLARILISVFFGMIFAWPFMSRGLPTESD